MGSPGLSTNGTLVQTLSNSWEITEKDCLYEGKQTLSNRARQLKIAVFFSVLHFFNAVNLLCFFLPCLGFLPPCRTSNSQKWGSSVAETAAPLSRIPGT